jgi:uncharacterized protein YbaP (TraB family)
VTQIRATRRSVLFFVSAALALPAGFAAAGATTSGPLLWVAAQGKATVYLFPFGEPKDDTWLSPTLKQAFASSSELWMELAPPSPNDNINGLYEDLGHDSANTLFNALTPPIRARALQYMTELNMSRDSLQSMRPWRAYYAYVTAFSAKYHRSSGFTKVAPAQLPPDQVLGALALEQHKSVHFEITMTEWIRKLAATPIEVQNEYLEWLFDYFDDDKKGRDRKRFDWMQGHLNSHAIDIMRNQLPGLYEVMDGERNRWWVHQVDDLLSRSGTYFVAIGQNHFSDSRGIPTLLIEQGVVPAAHLKTIR